MLGARSQEAHEAENSKVKAILRVRPPLPHEERKHNSIIINEFQNTATIANPRNSGENLFFTFDGCYAEGASQLCIFAREVVPILDRAMAGYNATVFAYGNTGAGKTFTMEGNNSAPGMIPLTVQYVLESLRKASLKKVNPMSLRIHASYLEIYREKVYDLLAANPASVDLPIREDANRNIIIPDLTSIPINHLNEFDCLWKKGVSNRRTAATKLNAHSSRSHSCLTLSIPLPHDHTGKLFAKLHLIDLAGSEDNRRTANAGDRLAESGAINKSLFVLGQVVDALNNKSLRVPFRDSKLTRLLQDSLGGSAYALIIANVAPTQNYLLDTVNTLNFASKSRLIQNNIKSVSNMQSENVPDRRLKSSSPPTISSEERQINRKRKIISDSKDGDNPFCANGTNNIQSMIMEKKIEEKVAQKLREITKGTILSPLIKGDLSMLSKEKISKKEMAKSPSKSSLDKPKKVRKNVDPLDPQVANIIPHVEPELLRIMNFGDLKEIKELKEIGAKRAQAIIDYREMVKEIKTLSELVIAEIITNKILGKIVIANSLGIVDFVPVGQDFDPSPLPVDAENHVSNPIRDKVVVDQVHQVQRHFKPLILDSDQF